MEKENSNYIPTTSELVEAYKNGTLERWEGLRYVRLWEGYTGQAWATYESVAEHAAYDWKESKEFKDIESKLMWGTTKETYQETLRRQIKERNE